jgi:chromate transporter
MRRATTYARKAARERVRPEHGISFALATRVWAQIGLTSFGGPAGQIALMHRMLVDERRWFSERRFLHALNYCMLLPGPEAQQLATYFGWLLHGVRGGLVAGGLFVLPGFALILALSMLYAGYGDVVAVEAVFYGVKPAVMAVVAFAVFRIGSRALRNRVMIAVAVGAFVGIFFLDVPFPLLVLGAGLLGYVGGHVRPRTFAVLGEEGDAATDADAERPLFHDDEVRSARPSSRRSLGVLALGLALWWTPVLVLAAWLGSESVYVEEGVLFSTAAVVTFGGAYAVLAYIAQQAVQTYGWLTAGEMLDGLGMAETTPGPLIMVVEFVGFLGAYRSTEGLDPMLAGVAGAVLVVWVTFVPSFLWILLGAPYIEYLRGNRHLTAALSTITAAVVGVILNLAIWFSLHVVFEEVGEVRAYGVRLYRPDWETIDPVAAALAVAAFYLLFRRRWGMLATLGASAAAGAAVYVTALA